MRLNYSFYSYLIKSIERAKMCLIKSKTNSIFLACAPLCHATKIKFVINFWNCNFSKMENGKLMQYLY